MNFDVVIVGAGLVGSALARALGGSGLSLALVDAAPPTAAGPEWDARIYAISPGSVALLQSVGAWQRLDASRVQAVERMQVFGDRPGASLEFSAYEAGVAALAQITESGRLAHALWQGLEREVRVFAPARCAELAIGADAARITLDSGQVLAAKLVVGADGGGSWVRRAAGLTALVHDYGQLGVVANFECEKPNGGTAFQWFRPDGVLAWLPLPGRRISMVWSTPEAHGHALLALAPDELARSVAAAGAHALGALAVVTPPQAFPLKRLAAGSLVAPRVALVGDAAHVVHPLAGQGVNLGFGDVRVLAESLAGREPFRDPGDLTLLRRYARSRAEAILAMRCVTDGMVRLFGPPGGIISAVRNTGLNFTDRLPILKNLLVRHALG